MNNKIQFTLSCCFIPKNRLDQVLVYIFPEYSRIYFKKLIVLKRIMINNLYIDKPNKKVYLYDIITIIYNKIQNSKKNFGENISLNIIYEDQYLLIINKPAGLVVHPGNGHTTGTLLNALLYYNNIFKNIPRAGIVHRLDKETTGLMIIAKDIITYIKLKKLLKKKKIIRNYDAFVLGKLIYGETINIPILRSTRNRTSMATHISGKPAVTHFKVIQKFKYFTHINLQLETGRTHQIRVHMLYIKYPILGDPVYFLKGYIPKMSKFFFNKIKFFHRQALHANHIKFFHPITHNLIDCYISMPSDMVNIIKYL